MNAKQTRINADNRDFLLEVGIEEIPASYQVPARQELAGKMAELLKGESISYGKITAYVTPRRLTLYIEKLATQQESKLVKIVGPPEKAAFDNQGKLTAAGAGFLHKQGLKKEDLVIEDTPKGKYLAVTKEMGLGPTKDILVQAIPRVVTSLYFPKKMRDTDGVQFARPIRTLVLLFGNEVIKINIGSVKSGEKTYRSPDDYFRKIKRSGIILDEVLRREKIKRLLEDEARKLNLNLAPDYGLLDEVTGLVELPVVISGSFSKSHITLPSEVIAASMAKYQRIFSLIDKKGDVQPRFLAVINGKGKDKKLVRRNYEAVLNARLNDAEFFFREDLKKSLEERREDLKGIILHQKLGTVFDKTERLKKLSKSVAKQLKLDKDICKILEKCSEICKSDLTTLMVREMTSLQGVVGREYYKRSAKSAETSQIAEAIYEHYLPRSAGDKLPQSPAGIILSLADKLDHVVSFIDAGILPTGSLDPYGIRRAGNSLVRIIVEKEIDLDLTDLIPELNAKNALREFIRQRAEAIFVEKGYPGDIISAVFASRFTNLYDARLRINVLTNIKDADIFVRTAKVCERTSNILKNVKEELGAVNESLFSEDLEKGLWQRYQDTRNEIREAITRRDYQKATELYAVSFFDIIHEFFDQVMVNVEDESLRVNRLSLCREINKLYTEKVADLKGG